MTGLELVLFIIAMILWVVGLWYAIFHHSIEVSS